ncbi:hypothetical protein WMY93_019645 [Mugilogobius chulae]|uniref:CMP-N-acetylneuraminate-beta-galactosamide-alpha-2,3-sialyltransferase 1 n=1 Tax=Mugilogobius chulae TaxID=88201 RepID=A0AAW0NJF7_9GOBI
MNNRSKVVVLMVCTACFATIWKISSSRLTFEQWEENEEYTSDNFNVNEQTESSKKTCSCKRCMSEYNTFFMRYYDKSVSPFLTFDENLSKDDFNWWKGLQRESGSYEKFNKTKESFFKVFPHKPNVIEPHPSLCRTCAVVGNSGNLKGSNYGRQIDAHDVVIRMNMGRTAGYEVDAGSKTTHRVMYPESSMDLDGNNTHLVLVPFKIMDLQWAAEALTTGFYGRSYAPVKSKIKANKSLVMAVNPGFIKYVHRSWLSRRGRYPSTGFMTLVLAMHICDEVNVFGFGADKNGNWNHYWEPLQDKRLKTGVHPGTFEYNLIQELAKQNKVTFNKGW